jgi:NDP-sugar pyrophosphorylase family protein
VKTVILAGGLGSRLSEETAVRPKPMVEIGGKRALPYLGEEDFCFTCGDGVADIDIAALIAFHREQRALATVTAVQPPGRFGDRNHLECLWSSGDAPWRTWP